MFELFALLLLNAACLGVQVNGYNYHNSRGNRRYNVPWKWFCWSINRQKNISDTDRIPSDLFWAAAFQIPWNCQTYLKKGSCTRQGLGQKSYSFKPTRSILVLWTLGRQFAVHLPPKAEHHQFPVGMLSAEMKSFPLMPLMNIDDVWLVHAGTISVGKWTIVDLCRLDRP